MGRENFKQASWAGGEFSPRMRHRDDVQAYGAGAEIMSNCLPFVTGGFTARPGFMRFGEPAGGTKQARFLQLQRSALQGYVLEFSDYKLRIWDPETFNVVQAVGGGDLILDTPWPADQLGRLYENRQADIMLISDVFGILPNYVIRHRGPQDWELALFNWRDGPWLPTPLKTDDDPVVLTIGGGPTGAVTLLTDEDVFKAGHVGSLVRIKKSANTIDHKKWKIDEESIVVGAKREFAGRLYQATSAGRCGNQSPIHEKGILSDGGVFWQFLHDGAGHVKISAVSDARNATADVVVRIPDITTTEYWYEQAYSGAKGFPAVTSFYQERLQASATASAPQTHDASAIGDFDPKGAGFKPGLGTGLVTDADAVRRTLTNGSVDPVVWSLAADDFYIATTGGMFILRGPANEEPITPAGALSRGVRGSYGSQVGTRGIMVGTSILHVEIGGKRIRELSPGEDPTEPNIFSEHLFPDPIAEIRWMGTQKIMWIRTSMGGLIAMTFDKAQGVTACTPMELAEGALVESIAVVRRSDGSEFLWALDRCGFVRLYCLASPCKWGRVTFTNGWYRIFYPRSCREATIL
ncbi:MAG: hypothetical protein COA69_13410 [Robiginitomaculum sp.]|nr:MAG: hypothetical protein COA69_13410 [Robiginitomaculum sp.]